MKKYIIRECEPESCDFSYYFEDDYFSGEDEDFCYTLFILYSERYRSLSGLNIEKYKDIQRQAEDIIDGFEDVRGNGYYVSSYDTFKECMIDNGISYNPKKCHKLKEWSENADTTEPEAIADFLTITTGKEWTVSSARGYCQGDYVELVFCKDKYTKDFAQSCGEIFLGAAKEFGVTTLDENGEEDCTCYGYIVADCQAWQDEEYKKLVCE